MEVFNNEKFMATAVLDQIKATIVADSTATYKGKAKRITTFELEYPRMVHAEFMTHRLFSRNAASTRAIPINKKISMVWNNPAIPVHWGMNQSGMQAKSQLSGLSLRMAKFGWKLASKVACASAWLLSKTGLHKQLVGRILEPFEMYKTVMTATEFENFMWLRDHKDAQPEIQNLAKVMKAALKRSLPYELQAGEWHTPYYGDGYWKPSCKDTLEDALKISSSCAAQVSFRTLNEGIEVARRIYGKLIESKPEHYSPLEHQATPIGDIDWSITPESVTLSRKVKGITHIDVKGNIWSGNFMGWIQHRQINMDEKGYHPMSTKFG